MQLERSDYEILEEGLEAAKNANVKLEKIRFTARVSKGFLHSTSNGYGPPCELPGVPNETLSWEDLRVRKFKFCHQCSVHIVHLGGWSQLWHVVKDFQQHNLRLFAANSLLEANSTGVNLGQAAYDFYQVLAERNPSSHMPTPLRSWVKLSKKKAEEAYSLKFSTSARADILTMLLLGGGFPQEVTDPLRKHFETSEGWAIVKLPGSFVKYRSLSPEEVNYTPGQAALLAQTFCVDNNTIILTSSAEAEALSSLNFHRQLGVKTAPFESSSPQAVLEMTRQLSEDAKSKNEKVPLSKIVETAVCLT